MKCSKIELPKAPTCVQSSTLEAVYEFKGEKVYKNDQYYGKIVRFTENGVSVEVDNGNKYMKGQIIDFNF